MINLTISYIDKKLNIMLKSKEKIFFEVKIKEGSIKNLLRPKNFKNIKVKFNHSSNDN